MEKWVYSGEQLREVSMRSIHKSTLVDAFLSSERKFIVLSSKGMGKTHLLRQKRKQISGMALGQGAVFIPSDSANEVDRQTTLPMSKSVEFWKGLSQSDWAMLWEISISLAAILNSKFALDDLEFVDRMQQIAVDDVIPKDLKRIILIRLAGDPSSLANPTYILNSLLDMNQGQFGKLMRRAPNLILQLYPIYISNAVYIFIDSFDQTLSDTLSGNIDHWVNGQTGLALAAYNIFTNCPHIKVFTSIRQEAWNKFTHENKMAMASYCLELKYSKSEIEQMTSFLTNYYEEKENLGELFATITKGYIRNYGVCSVDGEYIQERIFDYIYRHSLGTPRSILHLISSISHLKDAKLSPEGLERELRKEINLKSGALAATKIESEMAQFLTFLEIKSDQVAFFSQIHNNILSYMDLKQISDSVNDGTKECHPFCELYNLGLIGSLRRNADGEIIQNFRSPLDFNWQLHNCLPTSEYYIMHPSISAYLANQYRMSVEPYAIAEPESIWNKNWNELINKRSVKIFISYSTENKDLRDRVVSALGQTFLAEGLRHEIWLDERDITGGETIAAEISDGIEWANIMICLVTEEYMDSGWCKAEFDAMLNMELGRSGKKLLPYVFKGVDRKELGALVAGKLIPSIDEDDAAGLMIIGHHAKTQYFKSQKNKP